MATLVEYSKSSTALCRSPQCGHPSRNILKGTIRFKVPELGFTHLECLPSGCNISARNLEGLSALKQEDKHLVDALLKASTHQKSPAKVGADQKPFLTLLQNVLDTVTKATNVVSVQGDQAACEVLLQDLRNICEGHRRVPHNFGSPIAQVSLDGSTPHTVSTLSSRNTAPQSAQSSQSAISDNSAQSLQSTSGVSSTSTPLQGSSLTSALLDTQSAGPAQRMDQVNVAAMKGEAGEESSSDRVQDVQGLDRTQHSLVTIPEELDVPDPMHSVISSSEPEPAPAPALADPAKTFSEQRASTSAATTSPQARSSLADEQRSVSSSSSSQRKHARVIEAATAAQAPAPPSTVHPTHRNKHSKGYVALQAHLTARLMAQQYLQRHPPSHHTDSDLEGILHDPVYNLPAGTSSSNATTSSTSSKVLARLAPRSAMKATSVHASISAGAVGLGSPVPTRRKELLTELSQQYQSVITAGGPSVKTDVAANTSRASKTDASHYTATISNSRTSTVSGVPGSHSALRLLLRAENEQRRKTLPQALPRFRSATAAHLAELDLQEQQKNK